MALAVEPPLKRQKLSLPTITKKNKATDITNGTKIKQAFNNDAFYSNASRWNLEQDYENRSRNSGKARKESTRLPVKTSDGMIHRNPVVEEENSDDAGSWLESSEDEEGQRQKQSTPEPEEPRIPHKEQLRIAKEELARLALQLNADPEENYNSFKAISQIYYTKNVTVKKLALATQMSVFKDVIPGYRIRQLSEKDTAEKVSKEVRKKRDAEQSLLRYYRKYIEQLGSCARDKHGLGLDVVAISCTCQLLLAVPHFNFRSDLLKIVINKLSHRRVDDQSKKCISTLEKMFADDEDGNASLDAVRSITQMMKARKWNLDEAVLNTFLQLRLLTEFNARASNRGVDKPVDGNGKKIKQKREFRTKKQRKQLKELKAVEKDFEEADAIVSHEDRDKKQAETLKIVFATYFRILKDKVPHLTQAVLEGLCKFALLINQDFFGDLLEVLKELAFNAAAHLEEVEDDDKAEEVENVKPPMDPARTALLCTTTAFALLSAQDVDRLSLDLSSFTTLLYSLLMPHLAIHPDLELSHKTRLRLPDPHATGPEAHVPKINVSTTSTLLIRVLNLALSPRNTPPTKVAAFCHRLLTMALQVPEKTDRAILGLLGELARSQGKKIRPLWYSEERRGDGEFDPLAGIEACRPFAGSVWEAELLRRHFSPSVREGVSELESVVKDLT